MWTTLALTLHADGNAEFEMTGASPFPRHWIYDGDGQLAAKSGLTDFTDWAAGSGTQHTPWGEEDSPALVTAVGTALERTLSVQLMHGVSKPAFTTLKAGDTLVRQGQMCSDLYLVLDGVIRVDRDGAQLAEYGPGAILGARAEDFAPAETLGHAAAEYAIGLAGAQGRVGSCCCITGRTAPTANWRSWPPDCVTARCRSRSQLTAR